MDSCKLNIRGEELILDPKKACYWEKNELLMLSDLHLGKAGHFRKHGIPISKRIHFHDLKNLEYLISNYQPKRILLLGDLFHSTLNKEWQHFLTFLSAHDEIAFILIKGNHDILESYPDVLQVTECLELDPFVFTHDHQHHSLYNISGHIHPGISLNGKGRQGITIPCFVFHSGNGVLPAFGQFTGIKKIRPFKEDRIFGVVGDKVIEILS